MMMTHHCMTLDAASFLGMWAVMMIPMMVPAFTPMLWRYRQAVGGAGETRRGRLAALMTIVSATYFAVWTMLGAAIYPLGVMLMELEMQRPEVSRAVPLAAAIIILIAGALQFTAWKAHHLACCRESIGSGVTLPADAATAVRYGLRAGRHCIWCCAGPMAVLLVLGMMDLRIMAIVTIAITAERLAPAGHRVAQATGAIAIIASLVLIVQAIGIA